MAKEILCGIYGIQNVINGKYYVGQAVDILHRWKQHKDALNNGSHFNKHLQRSWNKYGQENFVFSILTLCKREKSELNHWERYWVKELNARINGYNKTDGGQDANNFISYTEDELLQHFLSNRGENNKNAKLTEKDVLEIIDRLKQNEGDAQIARDYNIDSTSVNHIRIHKTWKHLTKGIEFPKYNTGKSIDVYTEDGNYVDTYETEFEACEKTGVDFRCISGVCRGVNRASGGYVFRYHGDPFDKYETKCLSLIPIDQYDKEWNYIASFKSMAEAKRLTGINPRCCISGENYTAGGYHWLKQGELPPTEEYIKCKDLCTPVDQYDLNWNFIRSYPSMMQANRETGVYHINIRSAVIKQNKTAGGFHWLRKGELPTVDEINYVRGQNNWKTIDQYDENGILVASYKSIKEASEKTGINQKTLSCAFRGKIKTAFGYCWVKGGEKPNIDKPQFTIDQYDLNWNYIKSYLTATDAASETGISRKAIYHVLYKDQNQTGGFHWLHHGEQPPIELK